MACVAIRGIALALLAGCSGGHDHDHESSHAHGGHAHHAPHGGALTMLGNHAFQLELLPNPAEQRLELYLFDGEAENFVRITQEGFEGVVRLGEQEWPVRFQAVANAATGETVGDSSFFVAEGNEVSRLLKFELEFARFEIRGQIYESVVLPFPEGAH